MSGEATGIRLRQTGRWRWEATIKRNRKLGAGMHDMSDDVTLYAFGWHAKARALAKARAWVATQRHYRAKFDRYEAEAEDVPL